MSEDFSELLGRIGADKIEVLSTVAVKMALVEAEGFTGRMTFEVNAIDGQVGDVHITRGEVMRIKKPRRIRSSGVR